jgi:endonuclease/exonuclease/phosphatase (EEP) superfamily protein YafD
MIARILVRTALVGTTAVTLAGMSAPIHPAADLLNQFRFAILAAACGSAAAAFVLRARSTAWAGAVVVGLNAVLLALPLLWSAQSADRPAAGQALAGAGGRDLKIVTFNMAHGDARPVAAFLLQEDADVIVLQEVGAGQVQALRSLLRDRYPHAHACTAPRGCAATIFAKRPWVSAGQEHWTSSVPETIWVQFNDPEIGRLRVIGVHLHLPYRAEAQARQVDWLIAARASFAGPAIMAGDFNMTPWSYRLQRLLASADLRRHATFLRSWPTDRHPQFGLPAAAFLIDHVLTTSDIRSVAIRTGPNLGSDHLPVIARVRLPGMKGSDPSRAGRSVIERLRRGV